MCGCGVSVNNYVYRCRPRQCSATQSIEAYMSSYIPLLIFSGSLIGYIILLPPDWLQNTTSGGSSSLYNIM